MSPHLPLLYITALLHPFLVAVYSFNQEASKAVVSGLNYGLLKSNKVTLQISELPPVLLQTSLDVSSLLAMKKLSTPPYYFPRKKVCVGNTHVSDG